MTLPRDGLMVVGSKRICAAVIETILATVPGALNAVVTIDDQGDMRSELGLIERLADSAGIPCLLAESRAHADELFGGTRHSPKNRHNAFIASAGGTPCCAD